MSETRRYSTPLHPQTPDPYPVPMPVSARDVAAALRERHPGLGKVKLQKLLYYAQGHHLATFGRPLFQDAIYAWDMGPVVPSVWKEEKDGDPWATETVPPRLGEAELNTVGYVLSRYGNLSGKDLENLSHSEDPWRDANTRRLPGGSVCIEQEAIRTFFAAAADDAGDDGIRLDSDEVRAWLADAKERLNDPLQPDDLDALYAKLTHRAQ